MKPMHGEGDPAADPQLLVQDQGPNTAGGSGEMRCLAAPASALILMLSLNGAAAQAQAAPTPASGEANVPALAASATPPYCQPATFYPGMCGQPKQKVIDNCAIQAANDSNPVSSRLKARYDKARELFKFSFVEDPMGGCSYVSDRLVSYENQRETSTGTFARVGKVTTVVANGNYKVNKTVRESCSTATAGSVVRELVTVKLRPKKGWPKAPTSSFTYSTKPQKVC